MDPLESDLIAAHRLGITLCPRRRDRGRDLGTDLNRDALWKLMEPEGFEGVRLVSLDETWSAMMFRKT